MQQNTALQIKRIQGISELRKQPQTREFHTQKFGSIPNEFGLHIVNIVFSVDTNQYKYKRTQINLQLEAH